VTACAVLASCAVLAGAVACTSGRAARPSASAGPQSARWTACDDVAEQVSGRQDALFSYSCATVRVPQDWRHPGGDTFAVALIRARAKDQANRIGSLLVNPGGPGASGVELAVHLTAVLPTVVLRRFDVVGFDPRGVGRSTRLDCIPDRVKDALAAADPDPESQQAFDAQVGLWREAASRCQRLYGERLGLFSTEQTARDLETLRRAVGDAKTTYLGYSYGSLLGAVYAHLFPTRVRALVLDGAVDPQSGPAESAERQAAGFERAFRDFAAACRQQGSRCPAGPDAVSTLRRVLAEVARQPLRTADGRQVTDGHVVTAVAAALYAQSEWTRLARALAAARAGDGGPVLRLADEYNTRRDDGTYTDLLDAFTAVTCADEATPPTVAQVRRLQAEWRARHPLFGAPLAMSLVACAVWPAPHDPYPTGPARGAPPILVVGTTGDPATPYENTPKLARVLGTGVVLTWDGEGHTAYPQTRCVVAAVDAYLLALQVPSARRTCPAR
jgi:pimeloyl-ACP methyl ester carboxylesterase